MMIPTQLIYFHIAEVCINFFCNSLHLIHFLPVRVPATRSGLRAVDNWWMDGFFYMIPEVTGRIWDFFDSSLLLLQLFWFIYSWRDSNEAVRTSLSNPFTQVLRV